MKTVPGFAVSNHSLTRARTWLHYAAGEMLRFYGYNIDKGTVERSDFDRTIAQTVRFAISLTFFDTGDQVKICLEYDMESMYDASQVTLNLWQDCLYSMIKVNGQTIRETTHPNRSLLY